MTPVQFQRVEELFHRFRDTSPEQREALLDQTCADDSEVRAAVGQILAHADPDRTLTDLRQQVNRVLGDIAAPRRPAQAIEGYEVLSEIHRGGQGVVYKAVQKTTKRTVALKVLLQGPYASARQRHRFEREIDLVASLQHPNIVTIYDSGVTEGRHYFAMEYIHGQSLDAYLSNTTLSIDETLRLFAKICAAVNYAHQRGVIHRDLKPGNIRIDANGEPHVLDFGLAKAAGSDLHDGAPVTVTGEFMGTLTYASPEQTKGDPNLIDIRTDVYSLGVILYEMLTGKYPYQVVGQMADVLKNIAEAEPKKPSTIRRQINNEVETIVLKALAKEKERRYQSAETLARDVGHYLAGEPIDAKRDSTWYVIHKSLRRYRAAVAVAVAFVIILAGSTIALSMMYQNQSRAREEAETARSETQTRADELEIVTKFQASMLSGIDAEEMGRGILADQRRGIAEELEKEGASADEIETALASFDELVRKINATNLALNILDENVLVRAVETIDKEFAEQPLVEAALRQTVATTYADLGMYPQAMPQQERTLEIRRRVLGDDHPDTLRSNNNLAVLYVKQGRYEIAEPMYTKTLEVQRSILGEEHDDTLKTMNNLALVHAERGRFGEAEALYLKVLTIRERVLGKGHPATLFAVNNLAVLYGDRGQHDEAETLLIETLEIRTRVLGEEHPDTLISMNNLAAMYWSPDKYVKAESLYKKTLEIQQRVLGDKHPETLTSMSNLGLVYLQQGRYDQAEPLLVTTLELRRDVLGEEHAHTLDSMNGLAALYDSRSEYAQAEPLFVRALELRKRVRGEEHLDTLLSMNNLGELYIKLGRHNEASQLLVAAVEGARRSLPEGHWITGVFLTTHGVSLARLEQYDGAEAVLLESHELLQTVLGPTHEHTVKVIQSLADLYAAWHAAEPDQGYDAQAAEWRAKLPAPERADSLIKSGMRLLEDGRHAEAEAPLGECLEIRQEALAEGHWLIFNTQSCLGESLAGQGADPSQALEARIEKLREAETLLLEGYEGMKDHPDAPDERKREALERIVKLYEAWHKAEPDQDYDAKAAEWRAKLPETPAESSGSDSSSGLTSSPTGD